MPVGGDLSVTVVVTNTGGITLSNLSYRLVGERAPYLELVEGTDEAKQEGKVPPGATGEVTFKLRAAQEGTATLQVYVMVHVHTDPPYTESLLSEKRSVLVIAP